MKQRRLGLYKIDLKYIRDLAKADDNIMSISPQVNKQSRPFVGIVIICDDKRYCIPLSSPKEKHYKMKNDIDFLKIYDKDSLIGILNINNMIPVDESVITPLDLKITKKDLTPVKYYKILCSKQLTWCQANEEIIIRKANKLYSIVASDKDFYQLKKRCCDFKKLEYILAKRNNKYDKLTR